MEIRNIYGALALLSLMIVSCGRGDKSDVSKDTGGSAIIETGELAAINSQSITAQSYGYIGELKVIGIIEHGSVVNKGDSIVQIDPSGLGKSILEVETQLESQLTSLATLEVNQANKDSDAESRRKNEEATFNQRKLELESSRFESEKIRKIKELEFKQAEITLMKERRRSELQKIIDYNDMKNQKVRVQQLQTRIKDMYAVLPKLTIRSESSGVFQIARNNRTRTLINVGDIVYSNNPVANIPDLSSMKVMTFINEVDFMKIYIGQKVRVRLDAMPKEAFEGEVMFIGKLCLPREGGNSRERGFEVEVKMNGNDQRLKPGMTVSCEYLDPKLN